ncbi:MAG: DUF748 domain-containing protein [Limisphaerales bacterium]
MLNTTLHVLKQSRWYRRLLWAGAAFLVYVLVGFFILPPILKSQLVKRLPAITKRQAAIRQVKINPLALSLTIRGLSLTEPNGQVFASWDELYVNFQLSSLFRFAWTFAEIGLKQPYGHVALFKDGRFNFANMFDDTVPPPPKPEKPGALPRVNVWWLHIDDGAVALDDETHRLPLHTEFKPINISLTNLTTRVGKGSVYSFQASSDSGRTFSWAGSLVVQPFESHGHLELAGGELGKWTPMMRDYLRSEIIEGRLYVRADYALAAGTNGFDAALTNGALELTGLKVKDLNTGEIVTTLPWLSLQSLDFDLRQHKLHVSKVKIARYTNVVRLEKDGALNLNLLLEQPPAKPAPTNVPPPTPSAPWTVSVDDFALTDGAISFADLSRRSRFETTLKPIQFHLQRFTTRPDSDAAYEFSIPTEAGEQVSGSGTFSIAPLRSAGEVKLAGLEIKKYAPYYEANLRGEVLAGKLDAGVQYRFASSSNAPLVTVSNAGVALTGFQLKAADSGETVVGIPSFSVERTEASLADRRIEVGLVKSSGGSILARQMKDGKINLLELLNLPAAKPAETNSPAPGEPPWTVLLKELAFDGYAIKLEDQKPAKPAALSLDQLAFTVKGLSTASNEPMTVSLSARLNQAGTVTAQGTAKVAPPLADVEISVSDLDLRPFQPYVNEQVRLTITSGRFGMQGQVHYAPPAANAPLLKFAGDLSLTNFVTTDQALFKEFVKWNALNVTGIDLDLQPNQLQVQEVKWRGLQTSVIIGPDHRPNLKTLLPEKATGAVATPAGFTSTAPPAKAGEFPLQLRALVLENAAFRFTDESIEPHATFDVEEFGGAIRGLSSQEQSTATVDLQGKVDAASPFAISGKVNPLAKDLQLDLTVAFTNTDLTAFSTYLEKYAGHPLNKGKLTMGLHYDINQKQLKAENKFLIDHFTLGPRNDSTNATHLPVKLAVALLKDRNGQINLDIPLTGRTDDPQFKIAPLVFKVVLNLIVKAATSPFSLLGALVGGGEELSFVDFQPGRADIPDTEAQKLDKLAKALYERPAVSLEIAGSFDPDQDRAAVARLKLEQHLKILRLKELTEAGKPAPSLTALQLEPAERGRLLKHVFTELGTNQVLVLEAATAATDANTAAAVSVATLAGQGGQAATAKVPVKTAQKSLPASGRKGARDLMTTVAKRSSTAKSPSRTEIPLAANGAPLTLDQIEARLLSVIQVSENEQRDLIKQRAQAVQSWILQSGKVTADRLFIAMPKSTGVSAKGQSRVNLSLD